jgi:hypothetical protein
MEESAVVPPSLANWLAVWASHKKQLNPEKLSTDNTFMTDRGIRVTDLD